jgi:uncharacterized protein YutE (UPF0331/DUF86 family)
MIDRLRPRFEEMGYEFTMTPIRALLPGIMGEEIPDAMATRDDDRVIIMIRDPSIDGSTDILALRRRFEHQTEWRIAILHHDDDVSQEFVIPMPQIDSIRSRSHDVRRMAEDGHADAALVMAYGLLHSTLRTISSEEGREPMKTGSVVQKMVEDGLMDRSVETRIRSMISMRDRIVHGDAHAEATMDQVSLLLKTVGGAIGAAYGV